MSVTLMDLLMTQGSAMARSSSVEVSGYQLPDGGHVEVTDDTVVPMGDAHAVRQLRYSHTGDAERPACETVFEVRDGVPVCIQLTLTADNEIGVRAKDLKAIKLEELREDVYGYVGVFTPNPAGGLLRRVGRGSYRQDREHVRQATTRRKLTPKFLEQVAGIHGGSSGGGGFGAVKAAFPDVDERQIRRYIATARAKGFLDG
jgi:hypothetical protein